jgi:far upstream element-binding protein
MWSMGGGGGGGMGGGGMGGMGGGLGMGGVGPGVAAGGTDGGAAGSVGAGGSVAPGAEAAAGGALPGQEVVMCPAHVVGRIIGKGGETIRQLQAQTGTTIQIDQNFPDGAPRTVTVSGAANPQQLAQAVDMLNQLIMASGTSPAPSQGGGGGGGHAASIAPGAVTQIVPCPPGLVGRVIGKGGETIRELQQRSGASIQIDQTVPRDCDRPISISGSAEAVAAGQQLVLDVIRNGPMGGPGAALPGLGGGGGGGGGGGMGGLTRTLECEKGLVGRLIGSKGATIMDMQRRSNCRIKIDQQVQPCLVTISGATQADVDAGFTVVTDCMSNGPQGGGPGGPGGGYGGGPGGYGGYGGGHGGHGGHGGYGGGGGGGGGSWGGGGGGGYGGGGPGGWGGGGGVGGWGGGGGYGPQGGGGFAGGRGGGPNGGNGGGGGMWGQPAYGGGGGGGDGYGRPAGGPPPPAPPGGALWREIQMTDGR